MNWLVTTAAGVRLTVSAMGAHPVSRRRDVRVTRPTCRRFAVLEGREMTSTYGQAGVKTTEELRDFPRMLDILRDTFAHRSAGAGNAVLDFGLSETQVAALLSEGLELVAHHERYSLREVIGTLITLRKQELRAQENLLTRERSIYCSAFVRRLFPAAPRRVVCRRPARTRDRGTRER